MTWTTGQMPMRLIDIFALNVSVSKEEIASYASKDDIRELPWFQVFDTEAHIRYQKAMAMLRERAKFIAEETA